MATIRATCPECGDVDLTTLDVRVLVCTNNQQGSYTFRCPACRLAVAKPAEERIVDVLLSSGVTMSIWELPAELTEPRSGPPITHDDLLEFHFELERDGWFDRVLTAGTNREG